MADLRCGCAPFWRSISALRRWWRARGGVPDSTSPGGVLAVKAADLSAEIGVISAETGAYNTDTWVGCKGSSERYRGYPCGLWTLFHTLLAVATWENGNAVRVIGAIEGYITTFFTCTVCAEHFAAEVRVRCGGVLCVRGRFIGSQGAMRRGPACMRLVRDSQGCGEVWSCVYAVGWR